MGLAQTLKRLRPCLAACWVVSPLLITYPASAASQTLWVPGITNSETVQLRSTPDAKIRPIGNARGKSRVWVTQQSKNGFRAVYLKSPVQGKSFAWIPESSVTLGPGTPLTPPLKLPRTLASTQSVLETPQDATPPYTGQRLHLDLTAGPSGQIFYSVSPNRVGDRTSAINGYGVFFIPQASYLLGKNPQISGIELAVNAPITYIFPAPNYNSPILWSVNFAASYKTQSPFSPILLIGTQALPLPYVSQTLSTQIIWLGGGVRTQFSLFKRALDLSVIGAYSLNATSTPSGTSLHYQSPGWKGSAQLSAQIISRLFLGVNADYLMLKGALKLSGYTVSGGLSYRF